MALQFVGLGIGLLGSILAFFATISPRWAVSDVSSNVIESHKTIIGLWKQCQELGVGLQSCDSYDNLLLGADTAEVVARFFCVFAVLFGFIAVTIFIMGMTCAHLGQSGGTKKKMRCTAGVIMVLGGALILVSGGFMGYDVKKHFDHFSMRAMPYNQGYGRGRRDDELAAGASIPAGLESYLDNCLSNPYTNCNCNGNKQCEDVLASRQGSVKKQARQFRTTQPLTFGSGIFMAWIAGALQLAAGGLMLTQGCGGGDEDENYQSEYGYNQGQNIVNNDYNNSQRSGHKYV